MLSVNVVIIHLYQMLLLLLARSLFLQGTQAMRADLHRIEVPKRA
jgi:hypothetical protein